MLDIPWLSGAVVDVLLLTLDHLQVVLHNGPHFVNLGLHILEVFNDQTEGRVLSLPSFLGHLQQSSRSPSEEELEQGEAGGSMGSFSDGEEDIRSKFLIYHPVQHPFERLIELLHEYISPRVENGYLQSFDLQQLTQINH